MRQSNLATTIGPLIRGWAIKRFLASERYASWHSTGSELKSKIAKPNGAHLIQMATGGCGCLVSS